MCMYENLIYNIFIFYQNRFDLIIIVYIYMCIYTYIIEVACIHQPMAAVGQKKLAVGSYNVCLGSSVRTPRRPPG